jgi:U-box domain-containing protein 5
MQVYLENQIQIIIINNGIFLILTINKSMYIFRQKVTTISSLEIPESFLDPITWELMMQPITLPSGNVIDQTTLEKYGQNEAIWGRPFSDPFTGIPFNKDYKPIMATALKFRIDKFLLMNSNTDEVKNMARVLGHNSTMTGDRRIMEIPKFMLNENLLRRNTKEATELSTQEKAPTNNTLQRLKRHCHQLPAVIAGPNQYAAKMKARLKQAKKISNSKPFYDKSHSSNKEDKSEILIANIDNSVNNGDKFLLSNIKRFNVSEKVEYKVSSNCECCNKNIFYILPCKHVICRKTLLSIKDNQCNSCGSSYETDKIERVYGNILSR